tara:strand:+ start:304 stop:675 length:372 start_codon:yes stop_codon:yes gene_type:complete
MPTVCELQIEAKKKGLKGYSKLKKSDLERFVKEGKSASKKEPKKKEEPKRIKSKQIQEMRKENDKRAREDSKKQRNFEKRIFGLGRYASKSKEPSKPIDFVKEKKDYEEMMLKAPKKKSGVLL